MLDSNYFRISGKDNGMQKNKHTKQIKKPL
jgi:hypothetical protein